MTAGSAGEVVHKVTGGVVLIRVVNLTKRLGAKQALNNVSFEVAAGDFVALLGPNGAGKTTLLKILALLSGPTTGEIFYNGQPLRQQAQDLRARIGVISHSSLLYGGMTATENLRFFGKLYGVPDLAARIQQVLEQVGLKYVFRDPVRTYSRGMLQRLAIARAIIHDPDLLLLDEPYTGLDQQAVAVLNEVLRRVAIAGRTVLLVTHSFEQGVELANRVIILVRGQVVYQDCVDGMSAAAVQQLYWRQVEGKG